MGATRNTGYLENLIAYDASNNVAIATTAIDSAFKITMGGSVKMTGALSGTSATFSGNIVTSGATAEIMANGSGSSNSVGGSSRFTILDSSNSRGWILQQNASYNLSFWHNNSGWSNVINFTPTGAASFSSTITAATLSTIGTAVAGQNVQLNLNGVSGKAQRIEFQNSGVQQWLLGAGAASETSAFEIFNSTGIISLSINKSTNAATFSSSVTANGLTEIIAGSGGSDWLRLTRTGVVTWAFNANNGDLNIANNTASTVPVVIKQSGNVGIGTTSPQSLLSLGAGVSAQKLLLYDNNNNFKYGFGIQTDELRQFYPSNGFMTFGTISTTDGTTFTPRMTITSGGNVLIGKTNTGAVLNNGFEFNPSSNYLSSCSSVAGDTSGYFANTATSGTRYLIRFYGTSAEVGRIQHDGTNTSYVTSSDYRLKEDLKKVSGLDKVLAIKIYDFKWKNSDNRMDGVIAHELAEVLPYAVSGDKDEVEEDGSIKVQGVDYSKIVPILTKAIQELNQKIQALENR